MTFAVSARLHGALVVWFAVLSAGCTNSADDAAGASDTAECARFVVFDEPEWRFVEAVDYPADAVLIGQPALDWYSEFDRLEPAADGAAQGISLVISGHAIGLSRFRAEWVGDVLEEHHGDDGLTLVRPGAEVEPSVLVRSVSDDDTLMFLSYGLHLDELTEVASASRSACEQEWRDAGGQILDCVPPEPGCVISE